MIAVWPDCHFYLCQMIKPVCVCVFTGGQTFDIMYKCELDVDDTQKGSMQVFYEGDDFLSLDLQSENWNTTNTKAESFLKVWDSAKMEAQSWQNYLSGKCIEWLKLYVHYRTDTMERKGKVCNLFLYNNCSCHTHTSFLWVLVFVSVITHIIVFEIL